ncbi:unnamed protein product, partial [Symbiodinium microadriaticum]
MLDSLQVQSTPKCCACLNAASKAVIARRQPFSISCKTAVFSAFSNSTLVHAQCVVSLYFAQSTARCAWNARLLQSGVAWLTRSWQEDEEVVPRKSVSLQPRNKAPEEGWRVSVVPAPPVRREEAKGRTNSTTQQSGSPSLLPHMTDGFDEDFDEVTPMQTRRSKSRAATSASSMRVIDRVSHVSILASPSLTHLSVQEGALEKDVGCRILIWMPGLAYVLTAFFTLVGIVPLIGLHVRGQVFS